MSKPEQPELSGITDARKEQTAFERLLNEVNQGPAMRQPLIGRIEQEHLQKRRLVVLFTSFKYPVMLDDSDADMLQGLLQQTDLSGGLTLFVNSPGGFALTAERVIKICRSYSKDDFEVIVPNMAKSAATMVCFGARKIWMTETSELGPIDPQVVFKEAEGKTAKRFAVQRLVRSYEELFQAAVQLQQGRIEPFLQQLARYDAREIAELRAAQALAEKIAVETLASGTLKGKTDEEIRARIKPFLEVDVSITHGRPIYFDRAAASLGTQVVGLVDSRSDYGKDIWELYVRSSHAVENESSKLIESTHNSFMMAKPNA